VSVRLGIKVGPQNWREKLAGSLHVEHAEVYFDLARLEAYAPLFAWLKEQGMEAGLHASSTLADGLRPNLGSADAGVRAASAALLRRTIEVAAEAGTAYVVVHPGSCRDWGIRDGRTYVRGEAATPEGRDAAIGEALLALDAYAAERGVALLAENMPGRDFAAYEPVDRVHAIDVGFVPYRLLAKLGARGVALCVDVGHLYAEMSARAPGIDPTAQVVAATRELTPYARLVHLSTVVPPWNGTDSHNGFLAADYALGAIPTREQLLAWLALFEDDRLCAVPEPDGGAGVHVDNLRVLHAWIEEAA
jgi:sugar phosphate isomerase/epimerase